jgi:hypothetical protein
VRSDGGTPVECIAFGQGAAYDSVQVGSHLDLCYNIRLNVYGGNETIQLTVRDLCPTRQ